MNMNTRKILPRIALLAAGALTVTAGGGCSVRKMAVNKLGDALAGGGSTFARDDDPELIKAAVPFSLKLMESLLDESPRHRGLLLAASRGFTQYAYAFVQQEADEIEDRDFEAATAARARAARLYLRARGYGLRGLELGRRGFETALRRDPQAAAGSLRTRDVDLAYWTAAAWVAAIALSKDDPDLVAEQPLAEALLDRALELDEKFGDGAIHALLIPYEMGRRGGTGNPADRARRHFDRAVELTGGQLASPFVSLAEAVCVQQQDLAQFRSLLERALAVDPDARPDWRLENLVIQRRARWLLGRTDQLFLTPAADQRPVEP